MVVSIFSSIRSETPRISDVPPYWQQRAVKAAICSFVSAELVVTHSTLPCNYVCCGGEGALEGIANEDVGVGFVMQGLFWVGRLMQL